MNTAPLISIICPVFNADHTINKCIESILGQTLNNWELILIDDGSSDSSGLICDNFAHKDHRIKVIHKKNGGVSAARQTGLDHANGEYIIHVDPDDWVESDMLEELYSIANTNDADMVICDYYIEDGNTRTYKKQMPTSMKPRIVLGDLSGKLHGSCWNKLIKRSCCLKYKARFPVGINYSEDTYFNIQLLKQDIKISYLNKAFYHYVQTSNSITSNFTRDTLEMCKMYVNALCTLLPKDSNMVLRSKNTIKYRAFLYNILNNSELKQLYPEIKYYIGRRLELKIITYIAYSGHQSFARKIYNVCNTLLDIMKFN